MQFDCVDEIKTVHVMYFQGDECMIGSMLYSGHGTEIQDHGLNFAWLLHDPRIRLLCTASMPDPCGSEGL